MLSATAACSCLHAARPAWNTTCIYATILVVAKQKSAAGVAYATVKELIVTGELPGGDLISKGEVASRIGTSRTPVREAFLRLEAEGWMRLYPKRGALVVPVVAGEAEHLLLARQLRRDRQPASLLLERSAVRRGCGRDGREPRAATHARRDR